MRIAIEGCAHGELEAIYASIQEAERVEGFKVDLLLCCGDFQAVRNEYDLGCLAVKDKYRTMNSFHKYYSGELVAPVTTIFIGGNHEASNHLKELQHGGWMCPNIYYLGHSGVVNFGGLRIAGVSGIFKGYHFRKGYFEKLPYSDEDLRSVYHMRELEILKLSQITQPVDIFLSHDWPKGIIQFGDERKLLRVKKYLVNEVDTLGSPPLMALLKTLKPNFWFSAHMHVKFPAIFPHTPDGSQLTKFLVLDKVLPNRDFLQILDFPEATAPPVLSYDPEWLSILLSTADISNKYTSPGNVNLPDLYPNKEAAEESIQRITQKLKDFTVPQNFVKSAPTYDPNNKDTFKPEILQAENPQAKEFMNLLDSLKPGATLNEKSSTPTATTTASQPTVPTPPVASNPDEIQIDDL